VARASIVASVIAGAGILAEPKPLLRKIAYSVHAPIFAVFVVRIALPLLAQTSLIDQAAPPYPTDADSAATLFEKAVRRSEERRSALPPRHPPTVHSAKARSFGQASLAGKRRTNIEKASALDPQSHRRSHGSLRFTDGSGHHRRQL